MDENGPWNNYHRSYYNLVTWHVSNMVTQYSQKRYCDTMDKYGDLKCFASPLKNSNF